LPPQTVRLDPVAIRALRAIRGYETQVALARASGVHESTVSRMARLPGPYAVADVRAIAAAFDVEDLRILGVPDADAEALEAEASVHARMARLVASAAKRRRTGQPRTPPVVTNLAPGVA